MMTRQSGLPLGEPHRSVTASSSAVNGSPWIWSKASMSYGAPGEPEQAQGRAREQERAREPERERGPEREPELVPRGRRGAGRG